MSDSTDADIDTCLLRNAFLHHRTPTGHTDTYCWKSCTPFFALLFLTWGFSMATMIRAARTSFSQVFPMLRMWIPSYISEKQEGTEGDDSSSR